MIAETVIALGLLGAAMVAWHAERWGLTLMLLCAAVLPAAVLVNLLAWPTLPAGGALLVALLVARWRWSGSALLVTRWSARSRRKAGVASGLDITRRGGAMAMRAMAIKVRPSLCELSWWARLRLPACEVAVELARAGWLRVWASIEDVVLIFGGPRTGKTGWLAGRVLDAPGMVVVTSTRTDLLEVCAPLRALVGPVQVFNAVGLGGIATTLGFDPLTGCSDPVTATERASDLVDGGIRTTSADAQRWDDQGRRVLAALLHAAALGGGSMHDVLDWVADNDRAAREVPSLLHRSAVQAFHKAAHQFVTTNDRTRTSITNSIMPALGWLNHPDAVAAAHGQDFDVAALLEARATVFLLGAEEAGTGPLVTALTGHIAREARRLAPSLPGGRLDPNLTLALDEAALISPVPLESWTADMGGRGVTIIAAFQSRAQLLARYGEHKTATILNNTAAVMVFGGTRDQPDLAFWSTLAGERDEPIITTDNRGKTTSRSTRRVPVLGAARIANLPPGRAVLYRRGLDPVIGRVAMVWRRRDVRAHDRAAARADTARNHAARTDTTARGRAHVPWRGRVTTLVRGLLRHVRPGTATPTSTATSTSAAADVSRTSPPASPGAQLARWEASRPGQTPPTPRAGELGDVEPWDAPPREGDRYGVYGRLGRTRDVTRRAEPDDEARDDETRDAGTEDGDLRGDGTSGWSA
ncbi:TraM recognition domain-containing protein [Actinomycetospora endophytica]|uniref:TraM recognition domain-containing protein n=1 Tax=Actinomycetospora endophytica TaxID=2291215 RepID=A0ABS8P5Q8_9PSEU|nr:TraM recognition domain-containing protein [Actinomycetospora endophytica]MCD2193591.1 TraM recognition domain-containing protein [Actinomycetospora endophytica]